MAAMSRKNKKWQAILSDSAKPDPLARPGIFGLALNCSNKVGSVFFMACAV